MRTKQVRENHNGLGITVEFCEKCGALMLPKRDDDNKSKKTLVLQCRECGHEKTVKTAPPYKVEYRIKHSPREKIVVVEEESHKFEELTPDEQRERRKEILEYYESEDE
jgi:DNA-directed RNA polymerase subunit M/transcription elongation factor TFIIS